MSARRGGIGLFGATFLLFLALKLTGHIGWSWWWVTAPLWAPFAGLMAIGAGYGVGVLAVVGASALFGRGARERRRLRERARAAVAASRIKGAP